MVPPHSANHTIGAGAHITAAAGLTHFKLGHHLTFGSLCMKKIFIAGNALFTCINLSDQYFSKS
jgi:hypothetical protein